MVLEQFFVAAHRHARPEHADPAARARALPVLHGGHHGRALRLRGDGARALDLRVPDGAEGVHPRSHRRGDQRMKAPSWASRWVIVPGLLALAIAFWNLYVGVH